ncbi:MAG: L,D-transpeptidase [Gammaproteobacteria bacterium]
MKFIIHSLWCCLLILPVVQPAAAGEVKLLIDTRLSTLTVLEEGAVIQEFDDIAIGRFGTTRYKQMGDNRTPLGTFRIGWITRDTRYHRFMGIDYPDMQTASRALFDGTIDFSLWERLRRDVEAGRTPSQKTPLGGYLGIHGVGEGEIEVHRQFNWTNGCVALTNEQIDRLAEWVTVGTQVEIR